MVLVERYCPKCGAAGPAATLVCTACGASFKATLPLDDEVVADMSFALRLNQHLQANRLFKGHYRIVRRAGMGGFGAVYEAEDIQEKRRVAIKEISLHWLSPEQAIAATASFNREVELLSSLKHRSIPHLYEQLMDTEHWYVVMDFIEGETLEDLLERATDGRLPLEQALRIALQLCDVLDYLHSRQPVVIFRDIKPGNIMLTPEQKLYLIDFGVARQYKPGKAKDTVAFGSPGYAAPEQYGRAQTTPRADLYSLGVLLHQMLSGEDPSLRPFHFRPLRTHDRALPVELEKLVARLLELDTERRPASADMVRRKLQAIEAAVSVTGKRRKKSTTGVPLRPLVPLASADALARAFSTMGVTVSMYRGHSAPVRALAWSRDGRYIASCGENRELYVWRATLQPQVPTPWQFLTTVNRTEVVRNLAWSPDGRTFATANESHTVRLWNLSSRPRWWEVLAVYLGFHSHNYHRHLSAVNALSWSPDGCMIASGEETGAVHVWDARQREQLLVYQGHSNIVEDVVWSPDGLRIASTSLDHTVRVWDSVNGENIWRWRANRHTVAHALAWSPDGRYLACGANDGNVHIWDILQERRVYVYNRHKKAVNAVAWSPDGQRVASASNDQTVHVWDALDGKGAFTYHSHEDRVLTVEWSPDGQHLASAGVDTSVHVWKAI
jgi:eukaryotic-like serine/threonine-protein kinase